jgi:hypothetical protein
VSKRTTTTNFLVAAAVAVGGFALLIVVAACGSGAEGHGSSALYSYDRPWMVAKTIDPVGQLFSAGGVPLCTKGDSPVTLKSITPVAVRGEIQLKRIVIRRVHFGGDDPNNNVIGTYAGLPAGGHSPSGYIIPSPSPCNWPSETDPVYETVIAASRTGEHGGYIKNLRVRYRVGSASGEYIVPFTYALCGPVNAPGPCHV